MAKDGNERYHLCQAVLVLILRTPYTEDEIKLAKKLKLESKFLNSAVHTLDT